MAYCAEIVENKLNYCMEFKCAEHIWENFEQKHITVAATGLPWYALLIEQLLLTTVFQVKAKHLLTYICNLALPGVLWDSQVKIAPTDKMQRHQ